jgi:hypothetical protein
MTVVLGTAGESGHGITEALEPTDKRRVDMGGWRAERTGGERRAYRDKRRDRCKISTMRPNTACYPTPTINQHVRAPTR